MKVSILFDEIKPQDVLDDKEVLQQVEIVVNSLKRLGHTYVLIPCTLDLQAMKDEILSEKPDIVFNLLDTLDSMDCLAYLPIAILDAYQIKHTGPDAQSLALTTRKLLVKEKLIAAGLPTPRKIDLNTTEQLNGTWIIKDSEADGSFGMTDDSVIKGDTKEIQEQLRTWNAKTRHTAFAESYINGREFTIPFLCDKILPVVEITYLDYPENKPKILAQAAKWETKSFESTHTGSCYDFPLEPLMIQELEELAVKCVKLFKLNSWGRIDIRCTKNGAPFVIDCNVGSCLSEDAWWFGSLMKAGIKFDDAIQMILDESK